MRNLASAMFGVIALAFTAPGMAVAVPISSGMGASAVAAAKVELATPAYYRRGGGYRVARAGVYRGGYRRYGYGGYRGAYAYSYPYYANSYAYPYYSSGYGSYASYPYASYGYSYPYAGYGYRGIRRGYYR